MATIQIKNLTESTETPAQKLAAQMSTVISNTDDQLYQVPIDYNQMRAAGSTGYSYNNISMGRRLMTSMDNSNKIRLDQRESSEGRPLPTLKNNPIFGHGTHNIRINPYSSDSKPTCFLGFTITDEQKLAIKNGTFTNMNLGDYWQLSATIGSSTVRFKATIVGFNSDANRPSSDASYATLENVNYRHNARFDNLSAESLTPNGYYNDYKDYNHIYVAITLASSSSSWVTDYDIGKSFKVDLDSRNIGTTKATYAGASYYDSSIHAWYDNDNTTSILQQAFGDLLMPQCVSSIGHICYTKQTSGSTTLEYFATADCDFDVIYGYCFAAAAQQIPLGAGHNIPYSICSAINTELMPGASFTETVPIESGTGWTGSYGLTEYPFVNFFELGKPVLPGLSSIMHYRGGNGNIWGYSTSTAKYIDSTISNSVPAFRDSFINHDNSSGTAGGLYESENYPSADGYTCYMYNPYSYIYYDYTSTWRLLDINTTSKRFIPLVKIGGPSVPANSQN